MTEFLDAAAQVAFSNAHFHLILMPTEKCNFRCTYCYEDFKIGKMPNSVVTGVQRLISSRPNLDTFTLSWFGGEPLVASPIVLELSKHSKRHCNENGIALRGHMTTNGYFLDASLLEELVHSGITDYQISLDGEAKDHDKTRKHINGSGTFEVIYSNLLAARSLGGDFTISMRVHVHKKNVNGVPDFVKKLNTDFGDDSRFSVNLHLVERLGGPGSAFNENVFDSDDNVIEALKGLAGSLCERAKPSVDPYICYASRPDSLVIRADGRIAKCTVALNSDTNTVGRLDEDGSIQLDKKNYIKWLEGWRTNDASFLACPAGQMS